MRVDDRADKLKPQPALRAALVAAIETLPDARNFFGRNSGAGVLDRDDKFIGARRGGNFNATFRSIQRRSRSIEAPNELRTAVLNVGFEKPAYRGRRHRADLPRYFLSAFEQRHRRDGVDA